MYSYEIDNYLRNRNWNITISEYLEICNLDMNPQISQIKYNPFQNNFTIWTNDNWNWTFTVKNN